MSKERKFHQLIEKQEPEFKEELWRQIQNQDIQLEKEKTNSIKVFFQKNRNLILRFGVISATVFIFIMVGSFILTGLSPNELTPTSTSDDAISGTIASGSESGSSDSTIGGAIYYEKNDYEISMSQKTMEKYATDIHQDFLFFDWYDYGTVVTSLYKENVSGEYIRISEIFNDETTNISIAIFINAKNIKLEETEENYQDKIFTSVMVQNIWIHYYYAETSYVMFEHDQLQYNLKIENIPNEAFIFDLIEELLM